MDARENKEKIDDFREQAEGILKEAEANGLLENFLFKHTFKAYTKQIEMLNTLAQEIDDLGNLVEKEYVKGRPVLTVNPAITAFNNTANSAGKSVQTLTRIIKDFKAKKTESDPLMDILGGD